MSQLLKKTIIVRNRLACPCRNGRDESDMVPSDRFDNRCPNGLDYTLTALYRGVETVSGESNLRHNQ